MAEREDWWTNHVNFVFTSRFHIICRPERMFFSTLTCWTEHL